ncbi:MAG TPA: RNA 2',3'-cyclic phosphodiesterase [Gemmatimonadaceae bacterium]
MRLFLAIDPGDDCRLRLASVIALVRASTSGVRWTRDGKLHVTLSFLGEVDETRVDAVRAAARQVAGRHAPFPASISGTGVFPDWRRPHVVWLGLQDEGRLTRLGEDLGEVLASLGFPPDHPFRAHLTIGRVSRPLSAQQREFLRKALASLSETYPFDATRVVLMRSTLGAGGSEYSELASFPLGGA